jgi:hypothetical protein
MALRPGLATGLPLSRLQSRKVKGTALIKGLGRKIDLVKPFAEDCCVALRAASGWKRLCVLMGSCAGGPVVMRAKKARPREEAWLFVKQAGDPYTGQCTGRHLELTRHGR